MRNHVRTVSEALTLAAIAAGCCTAVEEPLSNSGTHWVEDAIAPLTCERAFTNTVDGVAVVTNGVQFPGMISYLYDNGRVECSLIGYSDLEAKRPLHMDDMFMQCSQTKGFCGVTVAKLVEEGKLKLEDPVEKYLPEFKVLWYAYSDDMNWTRVIKRTYRKMTVRDVMNHTAGFDFELPAKNENVPGGGWTGAMKLRFVAAEAAGRPLNFEPGKGFRYSNTGIDVGAAIVEVVTGMPWEEYLQKTVLDPLGMRDTTFRPTDEQLKRRMYLYEISTNAPCFKKESGWEQAKFNDDHVMVSAGAGLWTTANDQLKFYKMLMNLGLGDNGVRILREETVRDILAANLRPAELPADQQGYSLGLWVDPSLNGWFGHGGAWGTNCWVNWKTKQLKLTVVQNIGWGWKVLEPLGAAQDKFFQEKLDRSGDAYTGRVK